MMHIGMALGAALAFTVGGIFMKPADGATKLFPTLAVLGLFAIGAILMTVSVNARGELGAAYVVVLGLETVLAFAFGRLIFGEQLSTGRIIGLVLLLAGMILIEGGPAEGSPETAMRAPAVASEVR